MNYEKRYKEALEKARVWRDKSGIPKDRRGILDDIFPELAESEDERMRKELLDYLHTRQVVEGLTDTKVKTDWVTWLEKQGEQKSVWSDAEAEEDLFNYTNILSAEENTTLENLINKLAVSEIKQYNTQTATILFKNWYYLNNYEINKD